MKKLLSTALLVSALFSSAYSEAQMTPPSVGGGSGCSTSGTGVQAGNGSGGCTAATISTIGYSVVVVAPSNVQPQSATPASSGMSVTLASAGTYVFEIYYIVTSTATFNTIGLNGGTVTATSIVGNININPTGGSNLGATLASLSTTLTGNAATIGYRVVGEIVVNAGGTFIPTFASTAAATDTMQAGSWMKITRTN